ncbi:MAG: hypothetical protein K1X67_13235 [Fimbriimonadaceae bacterium]|nr:hypothetical protein [Fimbriimonadaceae bacterium]
MRALFLLGIFVSLVMPVSAQRLTDDDGRRDAYSGLNASNPIDGTINVQLNGASRKGIGRINDKDVSFVWMHQPIRKGYMGFRVKLVMMPRLGMGGVEKAASTQPLNDMDFSVTLGGQPLSVAYQTRMEVDQERDTYNYTASVPKTEWRWEVTVKADGTRVREQKPYTVYVNESRSAQYTRYVGQFDVIYSVPGNPSDSTPVVFDIRYGKAKQSATWTYGQFTQGGWVSGDDSNLNKGGRDSDRDRPSRAPEFAILPVQASPGVLFARTGDVQNSIEDYIRGRKGELVGRRAINREIDDLNLNLSNPRSIRERDLVRLGQDLRVDYVVFVVVDDLYGDSVTLKVWIADVNAGRLDLEGRSFIGRDHDQDDAILLAVADMLRPYFRR